MKKILAALLCAAAVLCGCTGAKEPEPTFTEQPKITLDLPADTLPAETEPITAPAITETVQPADYTPGVYPVSREEYSELIELETCTYTGGVSVNGDIEDFSGVGCLTGFASGGSVIADLDLPERHYNITVRARADSPVTGQAAVSGSLIGSFTLSGSGEFETLMYKNVYLKPGDQLMFGGFDGEAALDCVLIESSDELYELEITPAEALITPDADESAVALYEYLKKNFGEYTLSGQQVSQGSDAELEKAYEITGRYPAIRFGELMDYSAGVDTGDAELAIKWAERGGIVGYSWYWTINGSCYQARTTFDLENAVTDLDVATMDSAALDLRAQTGEIPLEARAVTAGIDAVAAQLKKLSDAGVAVLFRPLPEAASGQFWWSRSPESYKWLYELIYDRLSIYHGLKNLIWVWNGQSPDYYPGDDLCDIISLDLYYPSGDAGLGKSGANSFISAAGISKNKLIAISECSALPDPDESAKDGVMFSYASAWTGDFAPGGGYAPDSHWAKFYSSTTVVTLDEIEYNR